MTSTTGRDGRRRDFTYDNDNRETGETWVVSGSTVNLLTFTYDPAGNELTAGNFAGLYTMTYDAAKSKYELRRFPNEPSGPGILGYAGWSQLRDGHSPIGPQCPDGYNELCPIRPE